MGSILKLSTIVLRAKMRMRNETTITLDSIYGVFYEQLEVIATLEKIDDIRTAIKKPSS